MMNRDKDKEDQEVQQQGTVGPMQAVEGTVVDLLANEIPNALERAEALRQSGNMDGYNEVVTAATRRIDTNRGALRNVASLETMEGVPESMRLIARRSKDAGSSPTAGNLPPATEQDMTGPAAVGAYAVLNNCSVPTARTMAAYKIGASSMFQSEFAEVGEQLAGVSGGAYLDFRRTKGEAYIQHGRNWERVFQDQYGRNGAPIGMGRELAKTASNGFMLGDTPSSQNAATIGLYDLATSMSDDPYKQQAYMAAANQAVKTVLEASMAKDGEGNRLPGTGFARFTGDGVVPQLLEFTKNSINKNITADGLTDTLYTVMSKYAQIRSGAVTSGLAFDPEHLPMFAELAVDEALSEQRTGRVKLSNKAAAYKQARQAFNVVQADMLTRKDDDPQSRDTIASILPTMRTGLLNAVLDNENVFKSLNVSPQKTLEAYMNFSEGKLLANAGPDVNLNTSLDKIMTLARNEAMALEADRMNATMGTPVEDARVRVAMTMAGVSPDSISGFANLQEVVKKVAPISDVDTSVADFKAPAGFTPGSALAIIRELQGDKKRSPLGDVTPGGGGAATYNALDNMAKRIEKYSEPITEQQYQVRETARSLRGQLESSPEMTMLIRQWNSFGPNGPPEGARRNDLMEQRDIIMEEAIAAMPGLEKGTVPEDSYDVSYPQKDIMGAPVMAQVSKAGGLLRMARGALNDTGSTGGPFSFNKLDTIHENLAPGVVDKMIGGVAGFFGGAKAKREAMGRKVYAPPELMTQTYKDLSKIIDRVNVGNERTQGRLQDLQQATGVTPEEMTRLSSRLTKATAGMNVFQTRRKYVNLVSSMEKKAFESGDTRTYSAMGQLRSKLNKSTTMEALQWGIQEYQDQVAAHEVLWKAREAGAVAAAKAPYTKKTTAAVAPAPEETTE